MSELLALEGVDKRYASGTLALQDVSFTVGEHEFVSLLGPSGCGKSTVLKMIAGLAQPSAGRVRGPQGEAGAIGFVFQEPTLMPWASVRDNVWLPLRLQGRSRATAAPQVDALLATMGLSDFADAWPRELSGGMKMRVSIARALATQPQLLLMDEPFAALDEIARQRLNHDTLALWQAQRFTALFVTHSVAEAVFLSTRILVMSARPGRMAAEIAIDEPCPRGDAFRASERYHRWCVQVSAALQAAEAAGAGAANA